MLHDLFDQPERVLGALAEAEERDVRPLPGRHGSDVVDVDFAGDDFVTERGHDGRNQR